MLLVYDETGSESIIADLDQAGRVKLKIFRGKSRSDHMIARQLA